MIALMAIYIISGLITLWATTYVEDAKIKPVAQRIFIALIPGINFLFALVVLCVMLICGIVAFWDFLGRVG
jgi:hypothetical protein